MIRKTLSLLLLSLLALGTQAAENKTTLWKNYAPNGESFSKEIAIDFTKQNIHAEIDLSTCKSTTTYENILSIGDNLDGWDVSGVHHIHIYYTKSSKTLQLNWLNETATNQRKTITLTSDDLTLDLSGGGLYVNGAHVDEYATNSLSTLLNLKDIYIGSTQGDTRSWATYREVSVINTKLKIVTPTAGSTYLIVPDEHPEFALGVTEQANDKPMYLLPFSLTNDKQQWLTANSKSTTYPYHFKNGTSNFAMDLAGGYNNLTPQVWTSEIDYGSDIKNQDIKLVDAGNNTYKLCAVGTDQKTYYLALDKTTENSTLKRVTSETEATAFGFVDVNYPYTSVEDETGEGGEGSDITPITPQGITPQTSGTYYLKNAETGTYLAAGDDGRLTLTASGSAIAVGEATALAGTNALTIDGRVLARTTLEAVTCTGETVDPDASYEWRLEPVTTPDGETRYRLGLRSRDTFGFAYLEWDGTQLQLVTQDFVPGDALTQGLWIMQTEDEHKGVKPEKTFLDTETACTVPTDGKTYTVHLQRAFTTHAWNTFCSPIDITEAELSAQIGRDICIAEFTGYKDDNIQFTTVHSVEAGRPYLLRVDAIDNAQAKESITREGGYTFTDVTGFAAEPKPVTHGTLTFHGTYVKDVLHQGMYAFSQNTLYHLTADKEVKGFRCWFTEETTATTQAKTFIPWSLDGETTGIIGVESATGAASFDVYDLSGRQLRHHATTLQGLPHGIYVVNGRKVVR